MRRGGHVVEQSLLVQLVVLFGVGLAFAYIPVNVMLPLDTVSNNGELMNPAQLKANLQTLKNGGIDGVMSDVWWGIVERDGPRQYNWSAYIELVELVASVGLNIQFVTSFHKCGTNVGDQCYIPLPQWVVDIGQQNPDIWYRDSSGGADDEYLSLGVDNQPLFAGRTAVECYSDYFVSMEATFRSYLQRGIINQIQVGLGPAGEMRYPSYQTSKWNYCGIGEFQCYDKYMLANLKQAAANASHPEWGAPPNNAGNYNSMPYQTGFFSDGTPNNYASPYGAFFLSWYTAQLLAHGDTILRQAVSVFRRYPTLSVAAKVAGIHWWYNSDSHAAECTAGYYNTNQNNAYLQVAKMLSKYGVHFDFTCLEMTNTPNNCGSEPETLVQQTRLAANAVAIGYDGENALPLCSGQCYGPGFDEIYRESTLYGDIGAFTYLRINDNILDNGYNWHVFTGFVKRMHSA
jgi:beta-amylase